jgi:hypothetical protein
MTDLVTENACVIYVQEQEHVNVRCQGFLTYKQVVRITEYTSEMIQFYKVSKCVINLREVKSYPYGAEEYLRDIWYRRLAIAGVCRIAFVVPENIFGKASMIVVHAGASIKKIERDYFADELSAQEWLHAPLLL